MADRPMSYAFSSFVHIQVTLFSFSWPRNEKQTDWSDGVIYYICIHASSYTYGLLQHMRSKSKLWKY